MNNDPENGMTYMLLVVEPRGQRAERDEKEGREAYAEMQHYADDLKARGVLRSYSSLRNDAEGRRLQVRAGKHVLRDGPFTEAREMVGGFFLVDCATREEALEFAALCPAARWATIEVRETGPCYLG
ncbi:MAG: YciI family protein [Rhodanobacteraceae bacterium]